MKQQLKRSSKGKSSVPVRKLGMRGGKSNPKASGVPAKGREMGKIYQTTK